MQILDAQYERRVRKSNTKTSYHIISKMNMVTQSGEWLTFNSYSPDTPAEPDQIVAVYKKNNVLFINKEMYMFNQPGYCWDGQNSNGKYQSCIDDIIPHLTVRRGTYDSVYVYKRKFYDLALSDSISSRYYISVYYPLILKKEILDKQGSTIIVEELTMLTVK
jgi:ribosome biogenesis GTPase A